MTKVIATFDAPTRLATHRGNRAVATGEREKPGAAGQTEAETDDADTDGDPMGDHPEDECDVQKQDHADDVWCEPGETGSVIRAQEDIEII